MSIFNLFTKASNNGGFYIYDNNYVEPDVSNKKLETNTPVMMFTSMINFSAKYNADVAQEPIEKGSYTTDSIQNKATIIKFTATYAPLEDILNISEQSLEIQNIVQTLQDYKEGSDLVTISMQNAPMFDIYTNLKIYEFEYEINTNKTILYVDISAIVTRQNSADNGALPSDQVSQDNYSSKVDNGQQTPNNIDKNKYNFGNGS